MHAAGRSQCTRRSVLHEYDFAGSSSRHLSVKQVRFRDVKSVIYSAARQFKGPLNFFQSGSVIMLLLAWKLEGRPILLVGAGEVACTRVTKLLDAKCDLHVVAPWVRDEIQDLAKNDELKLSTRKFEWADLEREKWAMVLTAIDDRPLSIEIANKCREMNLPVNAADIPDSCDFYFGANVNKGPVKLLISTAGAAPALAKKVRQTLESALDEAQLTSAVTNIGRMKKEIRKRFPDMDADSVKLRMGFVTDYCENHTWEQMASLSERDVDQIVETLEITTRIMKV